MQEILKSEFGYSDSLSNALINHGKIRTYAKGVRLGLQGEMHRQMMFILSGNLMLIRDNPDATEQLAGILSVGSPVNEACFYHEQPFNTHPYTLSEVTCLCLPPNEVHQLIRKNIEFNQAMACSLSKKLLAFSNLTFFGKERDKSAKVQKALFSLFQITRQSELPITKSQLASLLGMSRNTVSLALKECEELNAIRTCSGSIVLKDLRKLASEQPN
ncbi:Crp/Fnr family transcriptional regulator [Endozoicomonas lisbonensis]|uniref:Crp/Fnr family transcriptional regulator n=1 Tax=Endozoicomonas lisbonensis TaxID=3120522 RepID=UPI00339AFEFD